MAKRFLTPLNLSNLASNPATGSEGDLYFNTTDNVVKIYIDGAWTELTGGGGGGAISVSASAPVIATEGDGWFDNTDGKFYVYDGSFWVEAAQTDAVYASYNRWTKLLSASTSLISGVDNNSIPLLYSVGLEQLFINGIFIDKSAYTASTGYSITLDEIAYSGDLIEILWLDNLVISDTYSKSESDAKYLTMVNASSTYATITQLNNINLTSAINTASAAAYASASAYTNSASSSLVTYTNTQVSAGINTASAAAVNYLIDSAPGTLDTLNELSAALNDDPNFYSTIQSVYLTQSNASATYLSQSNASATYASKSSPTFTGSSVFSNVQVDGILDVQEIREKIIEISIVSGSATANFNEGGLFYIANAPSANFTLNVTNVPNVSSRSQTVSLVVTQGATGRIPNVFLLDGVSQTIRWLGGSAPTPTSSAGKIDIFNFTIFRTSSSTLIIANSNLNI